MSNMRERAVCVFIGTVYASYSLLFSSVVDVQSMETMHSAAIMSAALPTVHQLNFSKRLLWVYHGISVQYGFGIAVALIFTV